MSSVPKNNKLKKQIESEIKKPPKNITKTLSENKHQSKKEGIIGVTREKQSEKLITNEPIEKEMLKGQEHKEEESKEEKNKLIESTNNNNVNTNINNNANTLNINNMNNSIDSTNVISSSSIQKDEKEKETKAIKPRETYLKEKMLKMNYSAKLLSSINKSLDNQVRNVQNDILDNQVLITTTLPKNISKLLYSSPEPLSSRDIPRMKDFNVKNKLKTIKELKDEEEIIKNNLKQLLENEKLIKDESYSKIYLLKQSQSNLTLDKILKLEKIKKMESKKNAYMQQIDEIEFKINEIINNNNNESSKKNK